MDRVRVSNRRDERNILLRDELFPEISIGDAPVLN
jgi:hypothetical protein